MNKNVWRKPARTAVLSLFGAFAVVGAVTWAALETAEVAVLRTFDPDGKVHDSRVWIADDESGATWIEAATAEKGFYVRLTAHPELELRRAGRVLLLRAVAEPGDERHRMIRGLLARKYGWRDRWIGWIADVSRSVAVRLEPR